MLLEDFINFSETGGFILCPDSEMPLHNLNSALRAAGEPVRQVRDSLKAASLNR
jgi:hypothetical protein